MLAPAVADSWLKYKHLKQQPTPLVLEHSLSTLRLGFGVSKCSIRAGATLLQWDSTASALVHPSSSTPSSSKCARSEIPTHPHSTCIPRSQAVALAAATTAACRRPCPSHSTQSCTCQSHIFVSNVTLTMHSQAVALAVATTAARRRLCPSHSSQAFTCQSRILVSNVPLTMPSKAVALAAATAAAPRRSCPSHSTQACTC